MPTTRSTRKRPLESSDANAQPNQDSQVTISDATTADFRTRLARFSHHDTSTDPPAPAPKRPRTTPTPSPSKASPSHSRRPRQSGYAPPSTYAHLPHLTDVITPGLIVLFVGTNPGLTTSSTGHAYAHPSNLFWRLLHRSGLTETQLLPTQDVHLPRLYAMGNTNLVARPSRDAAQLSKREMSEGTPVLEEKVRRFRPESVCIVGKGIWEAIVRWRTGTGLAKGEFEYGWQKGRMGASEQWEGARIFVATSTSGLSAGLRPAEKEAIWKPFGEWVVARREERRLAGIANPVWEGGGRKIVR